MVISLMVLPTGEVGGRYPANLDISSFIALTIGPIETTLSLSSSALLSRCSSAASIVTVEYTLVVPSLGAGDMVEVRIFRFFDSLFTSSNAR